MNYLGDFPTGETIYIPFHTFDSNDPSASVTITGLALADIKAYKDGSVTQRTSTAGFTLLDTDGIDFDGITGIHGISIDTSDNTDAGFWAAGSDYWIIIDSITVDAATVSFIAATFSIDNRGLLRPTTAQRTLDVTAAGEAGIDLDNTSGTLAAAQIATDAITAAKLATDAVNEIRDAITGGAYALDTDANGAIRIVDGTGARELNTNSGAVALVDTVTDVTNLHASAATAANQTTILNRLGAFTGSGVNTILGFFQALMRSDSTTPSDLGGTYDDATDSLQAIRDHVGDGTNLTEAGGTGDHLTAVALATDAVDADALATDAVNEIRDAILPTQNAVFNNIEFLFVAASDHVTPVTGATGTAVTRSIDGGAFGSGTGTLAEVGNGIYQYDASAADMNGGVITFRFTGTGGTPGAPDDAFVTIVTGGGV